MKGSSTVWIIIITAVITAILVGGGIYVWQKIAEKSEVTTPEKSTEVIKKPTVSPSKVVEDFMIYSLGTIPGSKVDYDVAKTYLSPQLQTQFTDDSFIPQLYGIQDGPDEVEVVSEKISDSTATVRVNATYGTSTQPTWDFQLAIYNNQWKISDVQKLSP